MIVMRRRCHEIVGWAQALNFNGAEVWSEYNVGPACV